MNEKNLKRVWLISIFGLLVAFSMYLIYINNDDNVDTNISNNSEKYTIVKNYSNFYTVNSCVFMTEP